MPGIFELKTLSPMLLTEAEPFDSPDHIYELKLDGIRALAYLDAAGTEIRNKRNKRLNGLYPELAAMHRQAGARCILDGELVVMTDGKPDFFALQGRSLMANHTRISLAAKRSPVRFVAYDILYEGASAVMDQPLLARKERLGAVIAESEALSVSRFIHETGIAYFELVKSQALEGIVAKRGDSRYFPGKRTRDWVKFKVRHDAEFAICGYSGDGRGGIRALALGQWEGGKLAGRGTVAFGLSGAVRDTILGFAAGHRSACPLSPPIQDDDIVWMEPRLMCTVEFMTRTEHGLRQPVFKGLAEE